MQISYFLTSIILYMKHRWIRTFSNQLINYSEDNLFNMKTYNVMFIICGIILISSFSCRKDAVVSEKSYLGEPFQIKSNETATLTPYNSNDSIVNIQFIKVISDSRCPLSSCYLCYGSMATIQIFFKSKTDTATINLTILGCKEEYECDESLYYKKDTLGYRFCLLRLDPYPMGTSIDPSTYKSKLQISKL